MRFVRRLLLLGLVGVGGFVAFNHLWDDRWPMRSSAAALDAGTATRHAAKLASRAATKAGDAASKLGDTMSEGALTAKIKSKMALDDHISARAIDVDTSGSVVTLTGVVTSADERDRAQSLARETEGVTQVVNRLRIGKP